MNTINNMPETARVLLHYWKKSPDVDFIGMMKSLVKFTTQGSFIATLEEYNGLDWIKHNPEAFVRAWLNTDAEGEQTMYIPEVPECFEEDYENLSHLHDNKSELLLTAMMGISYTTGLATKDDLGEEVLSEGIAWNNWSKETILWASRNYADFCLAVTTGVFQVKERILWQVKLLDCDEGYFYLWRNKGDETWNSRVGAPCREKKNLEQTGTVYKQKFTKKEIMAINENYWAFAELAEEEVV